MQDKLKENISKSEHLAELFAERERELQFFSSGHESQGEFFFLKRARIPSSCAHGIFLMLFRTVLYSLYCTSWAHYSRRVVQLCCIGLENAGDGRISFRDD